MDGWGTSLHEPLLRPPSTSPVSCWQWPHATMINADWIVWDRCLLCLATSVVIGPWIHSPHLSDFIPFDLPLSTAFVKGAGNFWYCYQAISSKPSCWGSTFHKQGVVLTLPPTSAFTCHHHWSGDNLILSGHQSFAPIPFAPILNPIL